MLKKLFAPVLFTSILVVAGCSSDEASKDLENADDVEIDEGDQKEEDTSKDSKQDTQGTDDDQTSEEKDSSADSSENSSEQEEQDSTKEQSNDTSKDEDQATEQQGSETSNSGSGGGSGEDTSDTSDSNETTQASMEQTYTFNEVNGEAVNVIQGINAVEIKRQNISGAKATSAVAIKAGGKQINLSYNKERDSFRNYQIKDVELEQLKQATVIIQG